MLHTPADNIFIFFYCDKGEVIVNGDECWLITAAKLGRRSHKMRELISEATRTVEDSQTAQALHGLLSLKSPADVAPSATSSVLTSVGELSMELIQQASSGPNEHQTAELHDDFTSSMKSSAKSTSHALVPSSSVDRHATLRAAILSPGGTSLQPGATGASGSAVQILLQMQQDDATSVTKGKPVRGKLASSTSTGSISVVPTSSVGANTTHVLLDRSVPVKISAASATPKAASAATASVPLSSVVRVSNPSTGPAVPIQLIATSQGVLAIPQSYKLVPQNVAAAATAALSPARPTQHVTATVASPTKRRLSASASSGGLLKVAKLPSAITKSQVTSDAASSVVNSEPMLVVANSLPHTVSEDVMSKSNPSSLPNQSLQTAIRDSYEKLFWRVYLQSSSFQNMPRPLDDGFSGSSEVSHRDACTQSSYCA